SIVQSDPVLLVRQQVDRVEDGLIFGCASNRDEVIAHRVAMVASESPGERVGADEDATPSGEVEASAITDAIVDEAVAIIVLSVAASLTGGPASGGGGARIKGGPRTPRRKHEDHRREAHRRYRSAPASARGRMSAQPSPPNASDARRSGREPS